MTVIRTASHLASLRAHPRRLLAVFAHPDDEAYGCAGALARAGADGQAATVLLTLTRGEASSMGRELGLTPTEVAALREARLEEVAALVHLDGLLIPGLPDGQLARLDLDAVAAPILEVLRSFAPNVVVTHDARGVNGHADHIAVHWAVRRALTAVGGARLALVAYPPETAEAARPRLLFATSTEEIDITLALDGAEIEAKEACLRVHEALVTLRADGADAEKSVRPPVEHFDVLGASFDPPVADLWAALPEGAQPAG